MHVDFRSYNFFFRLILAYACVVEVPNARGADKSEFCHSAMEESVRQDAEISTTQEEAVSHLTDIP